MATNKTAQKAIVLGVAGVTLMTGAFTLFYLPYYSPQSQERRQALQDAGRKGRYTAIDDVQHPTLGKADNAPGSMWKNMKGVNKPAAPGNQTSSSPDDK